MDNSTPHAVMISGVSLQYSNPHDDGVSGYPAQATLDTHLCLNALGRLMTVVAGHEGCQRDIEALADYLAENHRLEMARPQDIVERAEAAIVAYWKFLQGHRHGVVDLRVTCRFEVDMPPTDTIRAVRAVRDALQRWAQPPLADVRIRVVRDPSSGDLRLDLQPLVAAAS
ncbi:hypothetical protein ACWA7J_08845 [Leptothrix sp. BB-4]